ncbi:MAG TPA: DUF4349 domain-containing protein [Anaerolineae bacterium]|nr:DUF4349 domain-containing protein [Anaerolineae bacterium]
MNTLTRLALFLALTIVVVMAAACAAAATPEPRFDADAAGVPDALAATPAPQPVEVASEDRSRLGNVQLSPYRADRLIIKNGEMNLLVANTDRAVDQVTDTAVNSGGYIVSSRTWFDGEFKFATLTMGVPVDQFETVQRQLRAIAATVLSDTASGQDVSEEYVDLQSRLTNLEATAARIREFLAQAQNVEEALQVNARLTEVENEIEQIKGRMNYLKDRAAFSTIVVNLEPRRPTPTPTPTPTPVAWAPGKTVEAATSTLGSLLRTLGDMLIWLVVVVGPFAVPAAIVGVIVVRGRRKNVKRDM